MQILKVVVVCLLISAVVAETVQLKANGKVPSKYVRGKGVKRNEEFRKSHLARRVTEPEPHTYIKVWNFYY